MAPAGRIPADYSELRGTCIHECRYPNARQHLLRLAVDRIALHRYGLLRIGSHAQPTDRRSDDLCPRVYIVSPGNAGNGLPSSERLGSRVLLFHLHDGAHAGIRARCAAALEHQLLRNLNHLLFVPYLEGSGGPSLEMMQARPRRPDRPSFTRGRSWSIGFHVILSSLALLAVCAMLNYLAHRHDQRIYLSNPASQKLSPLTIRTLSELTNTVKIVCFFDRREPLFGAVSALLKEFEALSDKIDLEFVDYR